MTLDFMRTAARSYMIVKDAGFEYEEYELQMLLNNRIPGLLNLQVICSSGKFDYYYDITGMQSMEIVLGVQPVTREMLETYMREICDERMVLENYLLDTEDLVFSPDMLFQDKGSGKMCFCCIPGYHKEQKNGLKVFMEEILKIADHSDPQTVKMMYALYEQCASGMVGIEELLQTVSGNRPVSDADRGFRGNYTVGTQADLHMDPSGMQADQNPDPSGTQADQNPDLSGMKAGQNPDPSGIQTDQKKYSAGIRADEYDISASVPENRKNNRPYFHMASEKYQTDFRNMEGNRPSSIQEDFCNNPRERHETGAYNTPNRNEKNRVSASYTGESRYRDLSVKEAAGADFEKGSRGGFRRKESGRRQEPQNNQKEDMWEEDWLSRADEEWKKGREKKKKISTKKQRIEGRHAGESKPGRKKERSGRKKRKHSRSGQKNDSWYAEGFDEVPPDYNDSFEDKEAEKTVYMPQQNYKAVLQLVRCGNGSQQIIRLDHFPYVIGKNPKQTDCVIEGESVSRIHACIRQSGGEYFLEDMNSTNGTYLNHEILSYHTPVPLKVNDHIMFGSEEFVLNQGFYPM